MPPKHTQSSKRPKNVTFGNNHTTEPPPPPPGPRQRRSTARKAADDANKALEAAAKKPRRRKDDQRTATPSQAPIASDAPGIPSSPPPRAREPLNIVEVVEVVGSELEAIEEAVTVEEDVEEEEPAQLWRVMPKWRLRVQGKTVDEFDLLSSARDSFEPGEYEAIVNKQIDEKLNGYTWTFQQRAFKAWLGSGTRRAVRGGSVPRGPVQRSTNASA